MEISDLIKSAIEKGLTQQQLADVVFVTTDNFEMGIGKKVFLTKSQYCYTSIWTSRIMRKNSYKCLFLIKKYYINFDCNLIFSYG